MSISQARLSRIERQSGHRFRLLPAVVVCLCWLVLGTSVLAHENEEESQAVDPSGRVVRDYDGWQTYQMSPVRLTQTHRTVFPALWSVADAQQSFLPADSTMVDDNAAVWYLQAGGFFEQAPAQESWNRFNATESKRMMDDGDYNPAPYRWLEVPPGDLPVDQVRKYTDIFSFQQHYLDRAVHCRHFDFDRNARATENPIHYPLSEIQSFRRRILQPQRVKMRLAIAEGKVTEAIQLAGQSLQFAHHLSHDPYAVVTRIAEDYAMRSLTDTLYLIAHPECPNLYDAFNQLPSPIIDTTDSNAFAGELFFYQVPALRAVQVPASDQIDWAELIDTAVPLFGECKLKDAYRSGNRFAVALFIAAADQEAVAYLHQHVDMDLESINSLSPPHRFFLAAIGLQKHLLTHQVRAGRVTLELARKQIDSNRSLTDAFPTLFDTVRWSLPNAGSQVVLPQHRVSQMVALLQTIEVIRDHLARHGEFPESLTQTVLPAPSDPMTGRPVGYTRRDNKAILTSADNGFERQQIVLTAGKINQQETKAEETPQPSQTPPVRILVQSRMTDRMVVEKIRNSAGFKNLEVSAKQRIQAAVEQAWDRKDEDGNSQIDQRIAIDIHGETTAASEISREEKLAIEEAFSTASDGHAYQIVFTIPRLIRDSISSTLAKGERESNQESMQSVIAASKWIAFGIGLPTNEIDLTIQCESAELAREVQRKMPAAFTQFYEHLTGNSVSTQLRDSVEIVSVDVKDSTIHWKGRLSDQRELGITAGLSVIASALAKHDAAANRSRMRRLMIAVHNYHSAYRSTPPFHHSNKNHIHPGLSWRVAILPFLENGKHMKLYQKFDLTQPWDSPVNRPLINEMPDIFRPTAYSPESISLDRGLTTMLSTAGAGGTMGAGGIERFREVIDGLSNTVFLVEADAKHAAEWTSNRDYDIGKMELPSGLAVSQGKVNIAFGDAWSGQARADLPTDLWRGLFTVAGEEPIYKDVRKIRQ